MNNAIFFTKKRVIGYLLILTVFLAYYFIPFDISVFARQALALFLIAALFWAFEIIPLYATSICLVVALTFLFGRPDVLAALNQKKFSFFFAQFANPIIFLFMGGLILAKALSKHHIDQYFAKVVFRSLGKKSFSVLLGHLFLTAFLSMWISNTAATVISLSLIAPILSQLPKNDPFQKGLPIAVAFGASIGGIGTPIGTPPNALAIGILAEHGIRVSFLQWMGMAVPLMLIILIVASVVLWLFFPSKTEMRTLVREPSPLTKHAKAVVFGFMAMVVLWLTSPLHKIPESLVALLGVSYFVFFELVKLEDVKQIEWDVLFLMWGGLALGEAMLVSDLIPSLFGVKDVIEVTYFVFVLICLLCMGLSSFMSNTATANILLPIVVYFPPENQVIFSIIVALCCSLTLTFPISTPPNALAYSCHTFTTKDMFKSGGVISVFALIIILLGFDIIIPYFF